MRSDKRQNALNRVVKRIYGGQFFFSAVSPCLVKVPIIVLTAGEQISLDKRRKCVKYRISFCWLNRPIERAKVQEGKGIIDKRQQSEIMKENIKRRRQAHPDIGQGVVVPL